MDVLIMILWGMINACGACILNPEEDGSTAGVLLETADQSDADLTSNRCEELTEGNTYSFCVDVYDFSPSSRARIYTSLDDGSNIWGPYSQDVGWQDLCMEFEAPVGATCVTPKIRFYDQNGFISPDTFFVDRARLSDTLYPDSNLISPDPGFELSSDDDLTNWTADPGISTFKCVKCIEIREILVDACYPYEENYEGENEAVRFETGNCSMDLDSLSVEWPYNNWLGLCQDSTTGAIADSINSRILNGGSVREPEGDTLPSNANVLFLTSTNFAWEEILWEDLADDVILIFQCSGNIPGHFKNKCDAPCGSRKLVIEEKGICADSVVYDPYDMNEAKDGEGVEFTRAGDPHYKNTGCSEKMMVLPVVFSGLEVGGDGPEVNIVASFKEIPLFSEVELQRISESGEVTMIRTGRVHYLSDYDVAWRDRLPAPGIYYYRIMVSTHLEVVFSSETKSYRYAPDNEFLVMNRPDGFVVRLFGSENEASPLTLTIFDMTGSGMIRKDFAGQGLSGNLNIDMSPFKSGMYLLTITQNERLWRKIFWWKG